MYIERAAWRCRLLCIYIDNMLKSFKANLGGRRPTGDHGSPQRLVVGTQSGSLQLDSYAEFAYTTVCELTERVEDMRVLTCNLKGMERLVSQTSCSYQHRNSCASC